MNTDPESVRPAWTRNNPEAFIYWMKTGASELPADWVDDGEHSQRCLATDDAGRDEIDRDTEELIEELRMSEFEKKGARP